MKTVFSPVVADFLFFIVYPDLRDFYASYPWDPLLTESLFVEQLKNGISKTDKK